MQHPNRLKNRLIPLLAFAIIGLAVLVISRSGDESAESSSQDQRAVASSDANSSGKTKDGRHKTGLDGNALSDADEVPAQLGGVVLSPLGEPVVDALVLAVPVNQVNREPHQTTTQDEGHFSFTDLAPGTYKFSATAPGYAAVSSRDIALTPGQERDDLTLQLSGEGFTLSGTVEDSGGGPIPDAQINANLGWNNTTFRTQTNADGQYRLTLLPGSYRVKANAEMYASESQRLQLSAERRLDFKLTPAATLHGRVLERESSAGVAKATVRLHNTKGWQWRQRTVTTNAKGFFEFADVDPGNYELSAHKDNLYGTHNHQLAVTVASAMRDITIEMDKGFTISGRIKDLDGTGIARASVVARDRSLRSSRVEVASNADGSYQVQGLPPGRYSLRAKAEGFSNERLNELSIINQDLREVDLTLKAGVQLSGRLETESGEPVVSAVVRGTPAGGFWFFRGFDEDQSQEDGTFHLKNLPPGDIKVQATHMLKGATSQVITGLNPGEHRKDLILTVKTGTKVTGVVTWDDGTPAEGVLVYARDTKRGRGERAPEAIADRDGSFTLSPLWEGQFQIWATTRVATGWRPYPGSMGSPPATVSLDADNPIATVSLLLETPDQIIQGRVLDPEGNPLSDCQVGATREVDGRTQRRRWRQSLGEETTQTTVDGNFTLTNLPSGNYTLEAMHPNYPKAKSAKVAAGTTNFVFQLKQGASLAGVVKRGDVPITSYDITASTGKQVMRHHARLPGAKVSDPSGTFLIQGLPADKYTLTVETSDGSAGRLEGIDLAIGEVKTGLIVTLDDGVELVGKLVEHATGEALAGVQIFASSPGGRYTTQSDDQGDFSLTGIAQGSTVRLYVAADRNIYIPDSYRFTANEMQTNLGTLRIVHAFQGTEERFPLSISFKTNDGVTLAQNNHEGSGIQVGDTLLSVNGAPIQGVGNRGLPSLLEGPADHQTTLSLMRKGQNEPYTVTITHAAPAISDASQ